MANEVARALIPWSWASKEKGNSNRKPFTYLAVPGVTPLCAAAMSGPTSLGGCTIAVFDGIATTQ